jgi:DNA-directed RNA polymerase subunit RPC12/RpoP
MSVMETLEYISCPLCGMDDTKIIFKRKDLRYKISEIEFPVVRCRHCNLGYVNPRPIVIKPFFLNTAMLKKYQLGNYWILVVIRANLWLLCKKKTGLFMV